MIQRMHVLRKFESEKIPRRRDANYAKYTVTRGHNETKMKKKKFNWFFFWSIFALGKRTRLNDYEKLYSICCWRACAGGNNQHNFLFHFTQVIMFAAKMILSIFIYILFLHRLSPPSFTSTFAHA